ncbi:MAG TPA: ArsA-related P-loop ATPase [Desulfomonilia bacterium]|nr:ArsA-related P-loop ATPase [Desulfomonilia bacterium]
MEEPKVGKIAVTGKGGVGKSTITAALALLTARQDVKVLAIDADPDANLASALGIPLASQDAIVTIAAHKRLIEERTGAKVRQYGQIFKLNPEVSDIADTYAYHHRGIDLVVLGAVQSGGSGCACPENVLLRALVQDLVLHRGEVLFMDMEPGIEHLGRATARGVTSLITVVEPGTRSIESFRRIDAMAKEIGIRDIPVIANKVRSVSDEDMIRRELGSYRIIGVIPYSEAILHNDRDGKSAIDNLDGNLLGLFEDIVRRLL